MLAKLVHAVRSLPATLGRADVASYMPELDGLRCLAIAFVLVWHAALRAARYLDHAAAPGEHAATWYAYFPHGEVGVILFFFISGFVVSQPFLLRPRGAWKVGGFYRRRVLRIYPPYLVAITLCFAVLGIAGHVPTDANAFERSAVPLSQSFLASLFYLHGVIFDAPSRLNPPMWSLEIEVAFYAVLPPLMMLYARAGSRRLRMAALAAFIAAAVIASSLLISSLDTDLRLRWGLFYHAYLFLLGVLAADLVGHPSGLGTRKDGRGDLVFAAGLLVLAGIGFAMTRYDARMPNSLYAFVIQGLTILSLALVFHGAFRGRRASALLGRPWIRLVGTMCYSIYLTHIIVMTAIGEVLGRVLHLHGTGATYLVFLGILVPASLVAGLVFYVAVERPFARRLAKPKAARQRPMIGAPLRG